MKVNSVDYNTSFKARNYELRKADDIMRKMLSTYPSCSTTKVELYNIAKKELIDLREILKKEIDKIIEIRINRVQTKDQNFLNRVIEDVKIHKLANCGELAILAKGAFLANGYKNLQLTNLHTKWHREGFVDTYEDMDHCFLLINSNEDADYDDLTTFDQKTIVADPWLGFVDYIRPAINRFNNILKEDKGPTKTGKLVFGLPDIPESPKDTCDKLRREHPEFIV